MYGSVDAALLWLILLAKYLISGFNLKRSKSDSCIFYKKDEYGKLELVISVHLDDVLMVGNPDTLNKIKEMIKKKFNIEESVKVKKFSRVFYEWGRDVKGSYAKITLDKDVKKLVEGYENYTGSDIKVKKTTGDTGTTISKRDL